MDVEKQKDLIGLDPHVDPFVPVFGTRVTSAIATKNEACLFLIKGQVVDGSRVPVAVWAGLAVV